MDRIDIPACALHRQSTTVIVRIKMEVSRFCGQSEACPVLDCSKIVHRPSGCERCSRSRLISQYSDCDSGIVKRCRPYKSSAARSRYVNVCAAVCLLLLIGLSPISSAAPHRSHLMDRQKRQTDEENYLWRNPCSYNDTNSGGVYSPKTAKNVAQQAKNVYEQAAAYKDLFAKLHSFESFEDLLKEWKDDWLRRFPWVSEEVLPADKVLFQPAHDSSVEDVVNSIDKHLPAMYRTLKVVVASLHQLSKNLEHDGISADEELAKHVSNSMKDVRAVLCYFYDLMKARKADILPVLDSDLSDINHDNKLDVGIYVYRDTLNYLEYLAQVFQKMSEITR